MSQRISSGNQGKVYKKLKGKRLKMKENIEQITNNKLHSCILDYFIPFPFSLPLTGYDTDDYDRSVYQVKLPDIVAVLVQFLPVIDCGHDFEEA